MSIPTPVAIKLARFIAETTLENLPLSVITKARISIVDTLFSCLTIGANQEAAACLDIFGRNRHGPATVIGTEYRLSAGNAAYVNSVAAAGTLRNDTHAASASHPGMVVVPAVLALAEERGATGPDILIAIAVGYEVMCRLGLTLIRPESTTVFRPTGILGPVGAAAAAARLLGLDVSQSLHAISLACNSSSGLSSWADTGTNELRLQSGTAARNGIEAALMAERGIVASPATLDGKAGLLAAFNARSFADELVVGLGERFEMLSVIYKSVPTCVFAQGPCQLAAEIVHRVPQHAHAIRRVAIHTPATAARYPGCDNPGPVANKLGAQASIQFSVALILAAGGVDGADWNNFADPVAVQIASCSELLVDPVLNKAFPGRNGTRLDVYLTDGTLLTAAQDDLRPMVEGDIAERFMRQAVATVGATRASLAQQVVATLASGSDLTLGLRALAKTAADSPT